MNFVIIPGARTGAVRIPASKSQAHRLLICAALGKAPVTVRCDGLNADILATAACLRALGANIAEQNGALHVEPIKAVPDGLCVLPCGESGSTLRFLLPVVGALGADAVLIGRPFVTAVYGGEEEGVQLYVQKLKAELADTMRMCGAHSLAEIKRSMLFGF